MRKLLYTVALFVIASACSTKSESKPYNWEDDLHQRLLTDFCMTESQVKDYIRKYIPDVTDEQMRQWEKKYNSYLKTASGFASSIKACTHLYNDGVRIFITLGKLKNAVSDNPQGIVASISMNNLYIETATELVTVFSLLRDAVAKGGKENMLTGAERSKTLWALNDKLSAFSRKLHLLYLSIRYYTLNDVWNNVTAGMLDRNNGEAARMAMTRWRRAAVLAR